MSVDERIERLVLWAREYWGGRCDEQKIRWHCAVFLARRGPADIREHYRALAQAEGRGMTTGIERSTKAWVA